MRAEPDDPLLHTLASRFERHPRRHPELPWARVLARLLAVPAARGVLRQMEATGGEPDVIGIDADSGQVHFCDCAAESPIGRRSLCYDAEALQARKENRPAGSAQQAAAELGVELLTEAQYHALQRLGEFDSRSSSWLATPAPMRAAGGALFGDRRYGRVFVYHNGAQSYYAARGFRGLLRV